MLQKLQVISNCGARKVLGLPRSFNVSNVLHSAQDDFRICVRTFFCKSIVRYLGHCFRHPSHPITQLLSLPLGRRLTDLRMQGRRSVPSDSAQTFFNNLVSLGIEFGQLVAGRPGIRGESGAPLRWGDCWFEQLRDSVGWNFAKDDKEAIDGRVQQLFAIFRRESGLLPLQDASGLALTL